MNWELTGPAMWIACCGFFLMQIVMIHTLYETPHSRNTCVFGWMLVFMVLLITIQLASEYSAALSNIPSLYIGSFLLLLLFFYLFPSVGKRQLLFSCIFINNLFYIILFFARTVVLLFGKNLNYVQVNQLFIEVFLVTILFFLVSFALEIRPRILECLHAYKESFYHLLVFVLFNYLLIILLGNVAGIWFLPDIGRFIFNLIILCGEISGYMLAFSALTSMTARLKSEADARLAREQLSLSEKYYDGLVEKVKQTRVYSHNMRYIAEGLSGLVEKGDIEGIGKFISSLKEEMPESLPIWSRIAEIDAVIATCQDACRRENIKFDCDFTLPKETGISTLHLCIILGNCLRNALEACRKLEDGSEKFIRLICFPAAGRLILRVENSFDGILKLSREHKLMTSKTDETDLHGLGIASIQSTAEKYHGNCTWQTAGNVFTINVLLVTSSEACHP